MTPTQPARKASNTRQTAPAKYSSGLTLCAQNLARYQIISFRHKIRIIDAIFHTRRLSLDMGLSEPCPAMRALKLIWLMPRKVRTDT